MGEFAAPNSDPRLGSVNWAKWTDQASQLALIAAQARILFPVQEMMPFQRQVVTQELASAPDNGQKATFEIVVPNGEAWRILWIGIRHSNAVSLQMQIEIDYATEHNVNYSPLREVADPNTNVPLYPAAQATEQSNRFHQVTSPEIELFPRDRLNILQLTAATGTIAVTAILRYEQIPIPVDLEKGDRMVVSVA